MRLSPVILSTLFIIVTGCTSGYNDKTIVQCDSVEYVTDFPRTIELTTTQPLDIDLTACVSVFPCDSLLICETNGMDRIWAVYSLNNGRLLTRLLSQGKGHEEFVYPPIALNMQQTDSAIYCELWDYVTKTWYKCNLTKSIKNGKAIMDERVEVPFNGMSSICYRTNDSTFFHLNYKDEYNGFERGLIESGKYHSIDYIGNLNSVTTKENINALSASRKFSRKNGMVVEAMGYLNQINIYSVDSAFSKTICVGDQLTPIGLADHDNKRKGHEFYEYTFMCDDYFATLYADCPTTKYFQGEVKPVIQCFDYTGKPLIEIKLPVFANSFFISGDNLYLLSSAGDKELLYRYDLPKVI